MFVRTPRPIIVSKIDGDAGCRSPRKSVESCRPSRGSLDISRLTRTSSVRGSGAQSAREGAHTRTPSTGGLLPSKENRSLHRKSCSDAMGGGAILRSHRRNAVNSAMGMPWATLDWVSAASVNKLTQKRKNGNAQRDEKPESTANRNEGSQGEREAPTTSSLSSNYNLNEEIGRGTYGIVYSASEVTTGRRVAIKKIPTVARSKCGPKHNKAKQEAKIMKDLQDCTSAVQFRGYFDREDSPEHDASYIVMEHCSGGDLASFVKKHGPVTEQHAALVAAEVLNLLKHCHDTRILHGDVKAGNFVIISEVHEQMFLHRPTLLRSGWLKGVDFGTCQYLGAGRVSRRVGTPTHWAPEVFGSAYRTQADMWSLGVLIYHLMAGRLPYCNQEQERSVKTETEMLRMVMTQAPDFTYGPWLNCSPQARDFLMGLLMRDSHARMTATEALQHPWIRMHLDWQTTQQKCFGDLTGEFDAGVPCFS